MPMFTEVTTIYDIKNHRKGGIILRKGRGNLNLYLILEHRS